MKYTKSNSAQNTEQQSYVQRDRRTVDHCQIMRQHINLQLAALGQPTCQQVYKDPSLDAADSLLRNYQQQQRLLSDYRCPADYRIEEFLNNYLKENGVELTVQLPASSFFLSKAGLARELSLTASGSPYKSNLISSYRVAQGVLHNPKNDRRGNS